jgi:1-acyl-sn-glycerol-3-phosphate acyltransferase
MSQPAGKRELVKRLPVNARAAKLVAKPSIGSITGKLPFPFQSPTVPAGVEPPAPKRRTGADYDTDWARSYPARMGRVLMLEGVVRPAMRALAAPRITGLDRLADLEGPAIFAANHHSHVDTPLLLSSIPEPWRHHMFIVAAADYFFGNEVTSALSALVIGAIPFERNKVGRSSADQAVELINDGWSMAIFPEGGRSPDGWGQEFRPGTAYLAMKCDVPVIPVHLEGTGRILRKGKSLPKPSNTSVTFGHPMRAEEGEDNRRFSARIEKTVAELGDEASSDWWQARKRAHAGDTPSMQGPELGAWRKTWSLGDRDGTRRGGTRRRAWPNLD